MKTFIKNMTREQLKKVITDNENLQNEVLELLQESESFYTQDILNALNLSNYSIALYDYSYIQYNDLYSFLGGVLKIEKDYNFFYDDNQNLIKRLKELLTADKKAKDEDEQDLIYNKLDTLSCDIKDYIVYVLKTSYDFSNDDIVNEFIDLYHETYGNYYIKNNDYTKIYVMIEKTI